MNPVCITVPNVNQAVYEALPVLALRGRNEACRVGSVNRLDVPLVTTYMEPNNRVLFSPMRNANPFFHCMEAMWMLSGRNDLGFPKHFNKRFAEYSDDGEVIHGAYGYRWRRHFGQDQLTAIVAELTARPESRRAVLGMWDPAADLVDNAPGLRGKDVPCNTHAYFEIVDGALNMTVCCRSNDLIWGAYGANAVHFSFLLELMAARIGVKVGLYRQFSHNAHVYEEIAPRDKLHQLATDASAHDLYSFGHEEWKHFPLVSGSSGTWLNELRVFLSNPMVHVNYREPWFSEVLQPMYMAWDLRDKLPEVALTHAGNISAVDWRAACMDWLSRRRSKIARALEKQS